jgi:monoamine oxidase
MPTLPKPRLGKAINKFSSFRVNTAPVHICGEAYSDYQGFIEGALRSAALALNAIPDFKMKIAFPGG